MAYVALVGSREATLDQLELMIRLGRTWQDLGVHPSSGDAFGSDRAGWYGARQSSKYDPDKARIYVLESKRNRLRVMEHGFIIAQDHPECWTIAEAMALDARGSWGGIDGPSNQFKRDLHIRNVFQIHGHTLSDVAVAVMYCATPVGRIEREVVKGGTNTTLQLAKKAGIQHRINLATDEGYSWAIEFLKRNETAEEFDDIDWTEILKPDDPRLEHVI